MNNLDNDHNNNNDFFLFLLYNIFLSLKKIDQNEFKQILIKNTFTSYLNILKNNNTTNYIIYTSNDSIIIIMPGTRNTNKLNRYKRQKE